MNLKLAVKTGLVSAVFGLFSFGTTKAQELYTDNINFNDRIELVDSILVLDQIDEEEYFFPEVDMEENWSTDVINPYKIDVSQLPDSVKIDCSEFSMPLVKPTRVNSNFGYRRRYGRFHYGTDLKLRVGDTVCAAFSGKVRIRKFNRGGYGYYLVIRHNNGLETLYGHLSRFLVKVGDEVKAGQPIAYGGNTGRSSGPHLHFETRFMGKAFDPREIFDFEKEDIYNDAYVYHVKKSPAQNVSRNANAAYAAASTSGEQQGEILYHKVRKGDTLEKIARRNGTTIAKLCKLNGLTTRTVLRVGRVLRCS